MLDDGELNQNGLYEEVKKRSISACLTARIWKKYMYSDDNI